MTTITLVQAAAHDAGNINLMTAQPMGVNLVGLAGGAIQFQCANNINTIRGARTVDITYNGNVGGGHETIQVGSVIA